MSVKSTAITAAFVGLYCLTVAFGPAVLLRGGGSAGELADRASASPVLAATGSVRAGMDESSRCHDCVQQAQR